MSVSTACPDALEVLTELLTNDSRSPHQLGKYRVSRLLSCTGQAIVFEAEDSVLNRKVVLKHYPNVNEETGPLDEGRAISKVSSPFVAQCYGVEEINGIDFLVLEYVEGTPLSEILSQSSLTTEETVSYLQDICTGLRAVHQAGLVHGDLKPGNVIIDCNGHAKLIDFGLARLITSSPRFRGTAAYMPPEIARRETTAPSVSSDIFGVGAILHHAVTGRPPFPGATPAESITLARGGQIGSDLAGRTCPSWLVELSTDCLASLPQNRPASVGRVLSRLRSTKQRTAFWSPAIAITILLAVIFAALAPLQWKQVSDDDQPSFWQTTPTTTQQVDLIRREKFDAAYYLEQQRAESRHSGDQFHSEERSALLAECIPNYELAIAHQTNAIKLTANRPKLAQYVAGARQRLKELKKRSENPSTDVLQARRDFFELWLNNEIVAIDGNWDPQRQADAKALCARFEKLFGASSLPTLECKMILQRWYLRYYMDEEGLPLAHDIQVGLNKVLGPDAYPSALATCDLADQMTRARAENRLSVAEQAVEQALDVAGNHSTLTLRAYRIAATAALQLRQTESARESLEAALEIAKTESQSEIPLLYIKLSQISVKAKEFDRALDEALQAKAALSTRTLRKQQVQTKLFVLQNLFRTAAFAGNAELAQSVVDDLEKLLLVMTDSPRHQFGARRRLLDGAMKLDLLPLVKSQRAAMKELLDASSVPESQIPVAEDLLEKSKSLIESADSLAGA